MPPAKLVNPDDLQQILADALTSFSPLAALVGANATKSLSNHTSNSKQLWAASLAPIGALGIMSTVCKGSKLDALKDLLGAGEADIYDACAELGCASLYGVCPVFSKRGGLTCHTKNRNAGIAACAILRADWKLKIDGSEDPSKDRLDFTELSKFLTTIYMSTISGRLVWEVEDRNAWMDMGTRIRQHLLQSWNMHDEIWDNHNILPSFQESDDPALRNATGMIELHWPAPSMPLETNAGIVFLFTFVFIILPVAVGVIAATPLTGWQEPAASALLLGGQGILGLGHFLAQFILKRQRKSIHVDIPRQCLSDSWMLVDNVWFTSRLARRRLSYSPLSPNTATIGQYLEMKPFLPTWEVLVTLLTIGIGFLAFYIGARSSHLWVILFEIVFFFVANLCKGYVITTANKAYVTSLNNPGFGNVVLDSQDKQASLSRRAIRALLRMIRFPGAYQPQETELQVLNKSLPAPPTDKKQPLEDPPDRHTPRKDSSALQPQTLEPYMIPLPASATSSLAGPSRPVSVKSREPSLLVELNTPSASTSSIAPSLSSPHDEVPLPQEALPVPSEQHLLASASNTASSADAPEEGQDPAPMVHRPTDTRYRIYAKVAARRQDAIGLFYFSSPQGWGTAAHIIYEACHDQIQWSPHMRKEPVLVFPFTFFEKEDEAFDSQTIPPSSPEASQPEETRKPDSGKGKEKAVEPLNPPQSKPRTPIEACLILALDETLNEDVFWTTGQEFMSILVGAFTDTEHLVTEYSESTDAHLFGAFVYFTIRLILLASTGPYASNPNPTPYWSMAAGNAPFLERAEDGGMYPGVASMMRAINLVRGKYAFDSGSYMVPLMRHYARNAAQSVLGTLQ